MSLSAGKLPIEIDVTFIQQITEADRTRMICNGLEVRCRPFAPVDLPTSTPK